MNTEKLLNVALNENAVNTVVEIMHSLCASYIEGMNDNDGKLFNKYFSKLSPEMIVKYIHTSVFSRHANQLAEKYGISKPWKETSENSWEWEYVGLEKNPLDRDSEQNV